MKMKIRMLWLILRAMRQGEVENWMQLEGFALMRQRVEMYFDKQKK